MKMVLQGKGVLTTYWLVNRDGYGRKLPILEE